MNKFNTPQEAVDAAEKSVQDSCDLVPFGGFNCNDYDEEVDCGGWDGSSRRCSCGNRRVYWETSQHTDGTWTAYAEAY